MTTFAFYIENILGLVGEPCIHTFSPTVISKCLRIRAQSCEIVRTTKLQLQYVLHINNDVTKKTIFLQILLILDNIFI
jgi:hypothetical protein